MIEELHSGRFLRLLKNDRWEYVERTNAHCAVVIVAVTPENELLLVDQTRIPSGGRVLELPAGLVGDQDDIPEEALEQAANRELIEETGYSAARWTHLADGPPAPGLANETLHFLLAEDLTRVGDGGGVGGEDIIVRKVPLPGIENWLSARRKAGEMVDPKIYIGLYFIRHQIS
ncbi:MAG: NUDIX hydrolase [Nevskiales bacterium]